MNANGQLAARLRNSGKGALKRGADWNRACGAAEAVDDWPPRKQAKGTTVLSSTNSGALNEVGKSHTES